MSLILLLVILGLGAALGLAALAAALNAPGRRNAAEETPQADRSDLWWVWVFFAAAGCCVAAAGVGCLFYRAGGGL
jgi:hypothetical protein